MNGKGLETYTSNDFLESLYPHKLSEYAFQASHFRWAKDGMFSFLVEEGAINPKGQA